MKEKPVTERGKLNLLDAGFTGIDPKPEAAMAGGAT
jgi:hypothetical protein